MSITTRQRVEGVRGIRLTRRGRAVVVSAVVALLLAAFWVGTRHPGMAATGFSGVSPARTVVVPPGGTIWAIATRLDPDTDPRVTVRRIMEANELDDPIVHPGQRLGVPVRR